MVHAVDSSKSAFDSKTGASSAKNAASANSKEQVERLAETKRCEGDAMLKEATASMQCPLGSLEQCWDTTSLKVVSDTIRKYKAAISKYSEGLQLVPQSYNLLRVRAACFATLEDWSRCQEDALSITQVRPDILDGWTLLIQAMLERHEVNAAREQLESALRYHPGNQKIVELQEQCEKRGAQHDKGKKSSLQTDSCSVPLTPARPQRKSRQDKFEACNDKTSPQPRPKTSPQGKTSAKLAVSGVGSPLPVLLPGAARRRPGTAGSLAAEPAPGKQSQPWHARCNERKGATPHSKLPAITETSGCLPPE